MHLLSENVSHKVENSLTERKTSQVEAKTLLPSSERRKCLYRAKTSLAKAKTFLPSIHFDRKGEKQKQKQHNRAKKSKICLLSDISDRKTRVRICGRRFLSIKSKFFPVNAFPPLGATFSLGKRFFARLALFCYRYAYSLVNMPFRSGNAFCLCLCRLSLDFPKLVFAC